SISNLVAANPTCHKLFNLLYSLLGKFDASAPNGRASIRHRHGCTLRGPDVYGMRLLTEPGSSRCDGHHEVADAGCDGHHEMGDFRSRGSEANSVPATGDDSSTKFTGIFAS